MDQRKVAYCFLIIMMMLGVGAMGLMQMIIDEKDNEYTHPHEYFVSGAYGSESVIGTGRSAYINESESEYMYQFTTTVKSYRMPVFYVICDSSKRPIDLYENLGDVIVDDTLCCRYRYVLEDATVIFDIDERMVVRHYSVASDAYSLEAGLVN